MGVASTARVNPSVLFVSNAVVEKPMDEGAVTTRPIEVGLMTSAVPNNTSLPPTTVTVAVLYDVFPPMTSSGSTIRHGPFRICPAMLGMWHGGVPGCTAVTAMRHFPLKIVPVGELASVVAR